MSNNYVFLRAGQEQPGGSQKQPGASRRSSQEAAKSSQEAAKRSQEAARSMEIKCPTVVSFLLSRQEHPGGSQKQPVGPKCISFVNTFGFLAYVCVGCCVGCVSVCACWMRVCARVCVCARVRV